MRESLPSPPWGRGWPATGVFISRGRTGEGVKLVKTPDPCRKTRSLARPDRWAKQHCAADPQRYDSASPGAIRAQGAELGVVATGSVGLNSFGLAPLTRPAPAGESAGWGPSPPRGRGRRLSLARFETYILQPQGGAP